MNDYKKLICALENYFAEYYNNWRKLFLEGGCYWFASTLHREITDSVIMINRMEEHCAIYFDHHLYDITGKISRNHFRIAKERDISFMKKNYIPRFDVEKLERYLWKTWDDNMAEIG